MSWLRLLLAGRSCCNNLQSDVTDVLYLSILLRPHHETLGHVFLEFRGLDIDESRLCLSMSRLRSTRTHTNRTARGVQTGPGRPLLFCPRKQKRATQQILPGHG